MTIENDIRIGTTQAKNQDWANLGYYEQQNKQLTQPSENGKRILFIRDSITESIRDQIFLDLELEKSRQRRKNRDTPLTLGFGIHYEKSNLKY